MYLAGDARDRFRTQTLGRLGYRDHGHAEYPRGAGETDVAGLRGKDDVAGVRTARAAR